WDIAREMMPASRPNAKISWLQKIFMAVTFAEAGLDREALLFLDEHTVPQAKNSFLDVVGLSGVRVTYGLLPAEIS
ncbi:MAG: hypothetical protein RQ753_07190, partial [Desulfurivibrionaceae bacterium]|nr:hypothetical protein [Desulfurivibrionaceae bacterium]